MYILEPLRVVHLDKSDCRLNYINVTIVVYTNLKCNLDLHIINEFYRSRSDVTLQCNIVFKLRTSSVDRVRFVTLISVTFRGSWKLTKYLKSSDHFHLHLFVAKFLMLNPRIL